ncbi:hypothetical protein Nepgr_005686 [Nepenthes gracilis]|uniref:Uncharacterized protein n=1 Tax=Nepenthes gracilis TaxID=150966 RepID=A0AAD3S3M4_NEPGR|nr:hypothetical protein Nepgr_005686 [Nepenthes gracilis]
MVPHNPKTGSSKNSTRRKRASIMSVGSRRSSQSASSDHTFSLDTIEFLYPPPPPHSGFSAFDYSSRLSTTRLYSFACVRILNF